MQVCLARWLQPSMGSSSHVLLVDFQLNPFCGTNMLSYFEEAILEGLPSLREGPFEGTSATPIKPLLTSKYLHTEASRPWEFPVALLVRRIREHGTLF
jgi:hypothetical protein